MTQTGKEHFKSLIGPIDLDLEQRVRRRAYYIWVSEGWPEGRHQAHWDRAFREILEEQQPIFLRERASPSMGDAGGLDHGRGNGRMDACEPGSIAKPNPPYSRREPKI